MFVWSPWFGDVALHCITRCSKTISNRKSPIKLLYPKVYTYSPENKENLQFQKTTWKLKVEDNPTNMETNPKKRHSQHWRQPKKKYNPKNEESIKDKDNQKMNMTTKIKTTSKWRQHRKTRTSLKWRELRNVHHILCGLNKKKLRDVLQEREGASF